MTLSNLNILSLPNLEIQSRVWVAFWETEHITTHDRGARQQDQHQELLSARRGLQHDQGGMLLQISFYNVKDTGCIFLLYKQICLWNVSLLQG